MKDNRNIGDKYSTRRNRFSVMDSIAGDIENKSGGVIKRSTSNPISLSTQKRIPWGSYNNEQTPDRIINAVSNIWSAATPGISHGINTSVQNVSSIGNPAQYVAEQIQYLRGAVDGTRVLHLDTEWVGGGMAGNPAITEVGMYISEKSGGTIVPGRGKDMMFRSYAVQLKKEDVKYYEGLLGRLKEQAARGVDPHFSKDEARSLAALMDYNGTIDANGIITRKYKMSIAEGQSLVPFVDDIEKGLAALDPNKSSKALANLDAVGEMAYKMFYGGNKVADNPMLVAMHNGLGTDMASLNATKGTFGASFNEIFGLQRFGITKEARIIDTLVWRRAIDENPLASFYGTTGRLSKLHTLGGIIGRIAPKINTSKAHDAGWDAFFSHFNLKDLLDNGQDIMVGQSTYGEGSMLFSMSSMRKGSALDNIVESFSDKGAAKIRKSGDTSVYKNKLYKITKEFQYEFEGKQYFGVVLHNQDDDIYHTVAKTSQMELQNAIQSNFMSMDEVTRITGQRAVDGWRKKVAKYAVDTAAAGAYMDMFRGKTAFRTFAKYMTAYDYYSRSSKISFDNGKFAPIAYDSASGLTRTQHRNFVNMLPRLQSEMPGLRAMRKRLNGSSLSMDQKSVALGVFKNALDEQYGANVGAIDLPDMVFRQTKLFDPTIGGAGDFITVNARDKASLSNAIRNIAIDKRGREGWNFSDAKSRLRLMVEYMEHGGRYGNPIISKSDAGLIKSAINRFDQSTFGSTAREFGGTGNEEFRGISYIAQAISNAIYGNVNVETGVADRELMTSRNLGGGFEKTDAFTGVINRSMSVAGRYFSGDGTFSTIDNGALREHLDKVDQMIYKRLSGYSEKIRNNSDLGPQGIYESLTRTVEAYVSRGVDVDVSLITTDKQRGPGLELTLRAMKASTNVLNNPGAKVFIPIVSLEDGMLTVSGGPVVNQLRIVKSGTGYRLDTMQTKAIEAISYSGISDEVVGMLNSKNYADAEKILKRRVNYSLQGVPTSGYGRKQINEMITDSVGSNKMLQGIRNMHVSLRDLLYQTQGKTVRDLSDTRAKFKMMRAIINGKKGDYTGDPFADEVLRAQDMLGIQLSATGVKPTSASALTFNLISGDPRKYGFLGMHTDPSAEYLRQAQNFMKLPMRGAQNLPRVMTQNKYELMKDYYLNGITDSVELTTMFATNGDLDALARERGIRTGAMNPLERAVVYDDMATISNKAAKSFNTTRRHTVHLDDDQLPLGEVGDVIRLTGEDGKPSKYQSVIKEKFANADTGRYSYVVEDAIPEKMGMKIFGSQSGTKATVRIIDEAAILAQTGAAGIDIITDPKVAKRPGDVVASQLSWLLNELSMEARRQKGKQTVGKITNEFVKNQVDDIIRTMFVIGKEHPEKDLENAINVARAIEVVGNPSKGFRVRTPDNIGGIINAQDVFGAVERKIQTLNNDLGFSLNTNVATQVAGRKIYKGLMGWGRTDVYDTSATGKVVKWGFRELDMLSQKRYFSSNPLLGDIVTGAVAAQMHSGWGKYGHEGQQAIEALEYLRNEGKLTKGKNYGIIRVRDNSLQDAIKNAPDGNNIKDFFSDITQLPSTPTGGAYRAEEIAGSVVDEKLFNGNAYILQLPKKYELENGKRIDSMLVPSLHNAVEGGGKIHLGAVQSEVSGIAQDLRERQLLVNHGKDVQAEERIAALDRGIEKKLNRYAVTLANAVHSSDGQISTKLHEHVFDHSARLYYGAFNPLDVAGDENLSRLSGLVKDGHAVMSRKDFRDMLGDVKDADEWMKRAEDMGVGSVGLRWPTKDMETVNALTLHIMTADEEKAFLKNTGYDINGVIYTTVGTQTIMRADHDGDTMSVIMPQVGGKKAKAWQRKLDIAIRGMAEEDGARARLVAEAKKQQMRETAEKMINAGAYLDLDAKAILPFVGDVAEVAATEGRIQKDIIGKYSNLSSKIRRMAETVGSATVQQLQAEGNNVTFERAASKAFNPLRELTWFMSAAEEVGISAKKFTSALQKANVSITDKEAMDKFLAANLNFYESIEKFDIDNIVKYGTDLGMFKDGEFVGSVKGEDAIARAYSGKPLTDRDIMRDFQIVKDAFAGQGGRVNLSDPTLTLGLSEISSVNKAFEFSKEIASGTSNQDYRFLRDFMRSIGYGDVGKEQSAEAIAQVRYNSQRALSSIESRLGSSGGEVAEEAAEATKSIFSKIDTTKLKGVGAFAGGLWLAGSLVGSPTMREQTHGQADTAPSSDGQYVVDDPSAYAGAPMGAGPTARLMRNPNSRMNVNISASSMSGMTNEEIAALVSDEISRQSGLNMNIKVTSQDDRTSIDRTWLQDEFGKALTNGYV